MAQSVNDRKVALIGCGFVGSSSAFALMQSGLFSEMVLIDVDRDRAEGEALDISHGLPFARPMNIYAGDYDDMADAAITVITAGANQRPGETRLDLVKKNVAIFKNIIPEIEKRDYRGIVLVVSNPVDVLTYVTIKLSGLPLGRVLGSGTVLDTARFKYILGQHPVSYTHLGRTIRRIAMSWWTVAIAQALLTAHAARRAPSPCKMRTWPPLNLVEATPNSSTSRDGN